jgi:hypothetical protein
MLRGNEGWIVTAQWDCLNGQVRVCWKNAIRRKSAPLHLIGNALQSMKEIILAKQNFLHGRRRIHRERLKFAQREQTRHGVYLGAGQNYGTNRGMPHTFGGPKKCCVLDLPAQIRRRVEKMPRVAIPADRGLRLAASFTTKSAQAQLTAIEAMAVPLGKTTARGCA